VKETDAFCDSSALVPLFVGQRGSNLARSALKAGSAAIWWGTPVEITAALARLLREGVINAQGFENNVNRLAVARQTWNEVLPSERVRDVAQALVQRHPLRAADAFQLAAALEWAKQHPRGRRFICFDRRLAEAARAEGFQVETV
jgi:uncharacterized protein